MDISYNTFLCGNASFNASVTVNLTGTLMAMYCFPACYFLNYTSGGNYSFNACHEGTFSSYGGATSCDDCPAGTYNPSRGSRNCTNCAIGKSSGAVKASSADVCKMCRPNSYASYSGASNCTGCPRGTFNLSQGATTLSSCSQCARGRYGLGIGKGCAIALLGPQVPC